jgi:hypothetical protein
MRLSLQVARTIYNLHFSAGDLPTAIEHFTEAILKNPSSAILYANRGRHSSLSPRAA